MNKVPGIFTNNFIYPSNSKLPVYGNNLDNKETSLQWTNFASPLAFCYIEVPL